MMDDSTGGARSVPIRSLNKSVFAAAGAQSVTDKIAANPNASFMRVILYLLMFALLPIRLAAIHYNAYTTSTFLARPIHNQMEHFGRSF